MCAVSPPSIAFKVPVRIFVQVFGCGNMVFLPLSAILHLQKFGRGHFEVFAVTPTHSRNFTHLWKIKASQCAVMLRIRVPSQCAGHGLNNRLILFDCAGVPSSGQKDSQAFSNCIRR